MEDDHDFAGLMRESLEDAGHEVHVTYSGSEAAAARAERVFDVIIVDIYVRVGQSLAPRESGLNLITGIRQFRRPEKLPEADRIPILAISGAFEHAGQESLRDYILFYGADMTLAKPFSVDQLLLAVDRLLAVGAERAGRRPGTA